MLTYDKHEIKVGMILYNGLSGQRVKVEKLDSSSRNSVFVKHYNANLHADNIFKVSADTLVHKCPIVDYNGVPIHEGDKVKPVGCDSDFSYFGFDEAVINNVNSIYIGYHDPVTHKISYTAAEYKPNELEHI